MQLIGGMILHDGKIAEMKTGEGKTLVAILPAYLNSLTGKGVHIVTVNDYLAKRDSEWVGQVPKFLGLSVGLVQEGMTQQQRKDNYSKDITYTTNSELGFDYLRDNMAFMLQDIVQRPFKNRLLDEVDSILIDEARTPLIISGAVDSRDDKYNRANEISQSLERDIDYDVDEKARNVILNDGGTIKCEQMLDGQDLYDPLNPWAPYILNSIKAKELFIKDVIKVKDEEIIIVDEFTGRIMPDRRWSDGLHQSIEAKEYLPIQSETQTLASITYQNFFLLYPKLSGMTGTAKTEEAELDKIYSLEVLSVPTHRPMSRKDLPDLIYKNQYAKWRAIANECLEMYNLGRPVLVGTTTIEKSELLAALLTEYQLPYRLLNARPENIESESEIIAQAGCKNAITIATNMAGRGTDIVLGGNPKSLTLSRFQKFISYSKSLIVADQVELSVDELSTLSKLFKDIQFPDYIYTYDQVLQYLEANPDLPIQLSEELKSNYLRIYESDKNIAVADRSIVQNLGGLHVIGTERHESRRIDNQLRGRSGRQGDPGSSRFFLSLEDKLLRIFGGDKISGLMQNIGLQESVPIQSTFLNQSLESAQKKVEAYYFDIRKKLFEYDQALNTQRNGVYIERRRILEIDSLRDWIIEYAERSLYDVVFFMGITQNGLLKTSILQKIEDLLGLPYPLDVDYFLNLSPSEAENFLSKQVRIAYDLKESQIELIEDGLMRELERSFLLQKIDSSWKDHLQSMNGLRETIAWRGYGQKDPLIEYKNEAYILFTSMVTNIRHSVTYLIFRSQPILKV